MSTEPLESEKQLAIADAAFQIFARHGLRKTSMQMIADQAGMSRPALYLHFQNKEAVFRYLSLRFFTKVAEEIRTLLKESRDPVVMLKAVFEAFDPDGVMAILLDAEHGQELMEAKSSAARAEIDAIETDIRKMLTSWLAREATAGRINCADPEITGQTIIFAYYGLKTPPPSYANYKKRASQLAELIGKGLRP